MNWIAKCGLCFNRDNSVGESFINGYAFGEPYGVEIAYCPYEDHENCPYCKEFREKLPNYKFGDCFITATDNYDYDKSADKINDENEYKGYNYIINKFGGVCANTRIERYGTVKITYNDLLSCESCPNSVCVISGKKRDLSKARVMCEVETGKALADQVSLFDGQKKVTHRKVTDIIPFDVAQRIVSQPKKSERVMIFERNIISPIETANELFHKGIPLPIFRRYYVQKSTAKRDLLEDLKLVAEGFEVEHELDSIKEMENKKKIERDLKKQKKEAKKQWITQPSKLHKMEQISFWTEEQEAND